MVCLIALAVAVIIQKSNKKTDALSGLVSQLPADVEHVLEGYQYTETVDKLQISISGKKIIRRGRRVLGLRSNLVKANFFEEVHATIKYDQGQIIFSASAGEWDANSSHPFSLKEKVSMSINGKAIPRIKSAKVYLKQRIIQLNADRKETIPF